jgi:S1-C subfamily serine protease
VASRVRAHSVAIPRPAAAAARTRWDYGSRAGRVLLPAGFGVVVTPQGDVLTHAAALGGRAALTVQTPAGALIEAALVAYEPETGLAMLRTPPDGAVPMAPIAPGRAQPGTLVAAVAQWDGRGLALPAYVTTEGPEGYVISPTAGALAPGAPIYDMDGQLVAVAADSAAADVAYPAREAVDRLTTRIATGRGRESSIGLALQALAGGLETVFGDSGVLVSDVVEGAPADRGGIRPGDVVLDVGGTPVDSIDTARRAIGMLPDGTPAALRVLRGGRVQMLQVDVATAFEIATLAQAAGSGASAAAPEARSLFSDEQLRAAGIPPSAHVLEINGRAPPAPAQVARELRRTETPALVYLHHEGQRFFVPVGGGAP